MQTKIIEITRKTGAIIMLGAPTENSGMRLGEYFQATLDPDMVSPSGEYLRFDQTIQRGELHGWQRIECLTVCELLNSCPDYEAPSGCVIEEGATIHIASIDHG